MFGRNRNTASPHRSALGSAAAAAVIESLEDRRLMSATLASGLLTVTGTDAGDTIVVTVSGRHANKLDVQVNNERAKSFNLKRVTLGVHVLGGDGDDTLVVGDSFGAIAVTLHGDAGNDVLFTGAGNDLLFGGDGDDLIFGNDGDDEIDGGAGNDLLAGGLGDDLLLGGAGDDSLLGDLGNDRLYGQAGTDALEGGDDADHLNGGDGTDFLLGGSGADTFASTDDASEVLDLTSEDVHVA